LWRKSMDMPIGEVFIVFILFPGGITIINARPKSQ
jgi:hypothetical protein